MAFTEAQKKIIDAPDRSMVVSAAAGSGKTTVLAERILKLITDADRDTDIDRILVLTFTKAAAEHMKNKISDRLRDCIEKDPADQRLRRQAALVHNAHITTVDSFCNYVVRNSIADTDIDPGFRIADEGENKLLEADVLDDFLERKYAEGDEDFLLLTDQFATGDDDKALVSSIMSLYERSMSEPWPEVWLDECAGAYDMSGDDPVPQDIVDSMKKQVISALRDCIPICDRAIRISASGGYPEENAAILVSDKEMILDQIATLSSGRVQGFNDLAAAVTGTALARMPGIKNDSGIDESVKSQVNKLREKVRDRINDIKKEYFSQNRHDAVAGIMSCAPYVRTLCELTKDYIRALDAAKADRGILSFADCEHRALDILVRRKNDRYEYTDTAAEYRSYFKYVFTDEYQDSNMIQELILSAVSGESEGIYNRFLVGDVKQSIYRFRQANPRIFMNIYDEYEDGESSRQRIDLNMNFRSRRQVLDACNDLFGRIMTDPDTGAVYDDRASLKCGADYPDPDNDAYMTEILFADTIESDDSRAAVAEGEAIASRIEELISSGFEVRDGENATRPVGYGDIVILYRSKSDYAGLIRQTLEEHSIPATLSGGRGYFDTYEIRTILNYLGIIVNPRQDIPFYGALTSFPGGFSDSEVTQIRLRYSESGSEKAGIDTAYLYDACRYAAGTDVPFAGRLSAFMDDLERYRAHSEYMDTSELISEILSDTGYRARMLAMRGGDKRAANVDMLVSVAYAYSHSSYFGLYNFIRYVEQLKKVTNKDSEAETGDVSDSVRIMTTHGSKGLEFPVVFIARMGGSFNSTDAKGSLIVDNQAGLGFKRFDTDSRIRRNNLRYRYIKDEILRQSVAEEKRILYVAMTRAEEKLILVSAVKPEYVEAAADDAANSSDMPDNSETSENACKTRVIKRPAHVSRYIDWYLQSICDEMGGEDIVFTETGQDIDIPAMHVRLRMADLSARAMEENETIAGAEAEMLVKQLDDMSDPDRYTGRADEYLERIYDHEYPHVSLKGLYQKTSVSELKAAAMPDDLAEAHLAPYAQASDGDDIAAPMPRFISGTADRPHATVRGSAFHRIMELFDFSGLHNSEDRVDTDFLAARMDDFAADGRLSAAERLIMDNDEDLGLMTAFFGHDITSRMARAAAVGQLYREKPFMMGIPASMVDECYPEEETVLIQGIIDAWWLEDDGAVILDYKTDRIRSADRFRELYKTQLDLYAYALEKMHIKVKEKLIYSFEMGEIITI